MELMAAIKLISFLSKRRAALILLAILSVGRSDFALAQSIISSNNFGNLGLMQTPNARFAPEGELRGGYSRALPYDFIFMSAQPYDWVEATFRYSEFTNQKFSARSDDSYLDKSFDFKFRLLAEEGLFPAVAIGFQDVGGTGLLSSEYIVASKGFGDVDISIGLGWGRIGSRGDVQNPLSLVSDRFDRDREVSSDIRNAGSFSLSRLFSGDKAAFFGGVQWQPLNMPLSILVEREGNSYKNEPFANNLAVNFPVNVGLNYRFRALDLGVAYERGDQITFHAAFSTNVKFNSGPPKVFDPPPTPVGPPEFGGGGGGKENSELSDEAFAEALRQALVRQGFTLVAIDFSPQRESATVWFNQNLFLNEARAIGRVARSVSSLAPSSYVKFTLVSVLDGIENYRVTFERSVVREAANSRIELHELARQAVFLPPEVSEREADFDGFVSYPDFSWGMGPKLRQNVGDPNGFYYGQLWWGINGVLKLTSHLSLRAGVGFNIINNFDELSRESDSQLPHVRSDVKEYLQQGENNLVRLEANYVWPIAKSLFGRVSLGIFEEMYGGLAAEVLYRPFGHPWAVGLNLNRVRQRDYDQRFDFRDYEVTTGHATLYYKFRPLKLRVTGSVGRYLAGDYGATLDIAREFESGARFGIFATKTNVSSEEFGEGKFDKGFYITLPLDMFFPRSVKRTTTFFFRPLTRDGGQKVNDGTGLYGLTENGDLLGVADGWSDVMR